MTQNEYLMNIAIAVSFKSKDPSCKVGAIIVDNENRIVSTGYNGFVANCDETELSLERPDKYHYTIHAEMNALLFAHKSVKGFKLYITHGPCDNCLKHALQAGIREIYYKDPHIVKNRGTEMEKKAIKQLIKSTNASVINIDTMEDYVVELEIP
jgi:dCMP deaminase